MRKVESDLKSGNCVRPSAGSAVPPTGQFNPLSNVPMGESPAAPPPYEQAVGSDFDSNAISQEKDAARSAFNSLEHEGQRGQQTNLLTVLQREGEYRRRRSAHDFDSDSDASVDFDKYYKSYRKRRLQEANGTAPLAPSKSRSSSNSGQASGFGLTSLITGPIILAGDVVSGAVGLSSSIVGGVIGVASKGVDSALSSNKEGKKSCRVTGRSMEPGQAAGSTSSNGPGLKDRVKAEMKVQRAEQAAREAEKAEERAQRRRFRRERRELKAAQKFEREMRE